VSVRGFVLVELLVAVAIGSVVLFAIGSLYVLTVSYGRQDDRLTYMQRQGSIILEEMARHIRAADSSAANPMRCSPAGCDPIANQGLATCGVDPSLQVTNLDTLVNNEPADTYCFRLNTTGGNQLIRAGSGGGQSNMLTEGGGMAALTVSACPGESMFALVNPTYPGCAPGCANPNQVDICFRLSTTTPPTDSMTFRASFTQRN
jgi:prepilin-type N-terminal cleavage/methylation domain-containing protein